MTAERGGTALIDLEVYSLDGRGGGWRQALQEVWDSESFSAGETKELVASWAVPEDEPLGVHWVKIGVFRPGVGIPLPLERQRRILRRDVRAGADADDGDADHATADADDASDADDGDADHATRDADADDAADADHGDADHATRDADADDAADADHGAAGGADVLGGLRVGGGVLAAVRPWLVGSGPGDVAGIREPEVVVAG